MISIRPSKILLFASALVVAGMLAADQADAVAWLQCIPNYIRDRVLAGSDIAQHYQDAITIAADRFEAHLTQLDPSVKMDEQDKENLFMRFVTEEINKLKEHVKARQIQDRPSQQTVDDVENSLKACHADESTWNKWNPEGDSLDDPLVLESKDQQLRENLEELEDQMGLALDDATKEGLKARTKEVLTDLLHNEVRQIAAAILSAYMSGGVSVMSVVLQYLPMVKVKVVQYLINSVIDIVRSTMGTDIEIKPPPTQAQADSAALQLVPVSA